MSQPKRGRSSQAQNHLITILLALVIAGLSMWFGAGRDGGNDPDAAATPVPGSGLTVTYLDVGQGDCTMLIDAGIGEQANHITTYLKQQGVKSIDYLVCTHAHADHCGGMKAVIAAFPVHTFYSSVTSSSNGAFQRVMRAAETANLTITVPGVGDTFTLGGATVTVPAKLTVDRVDADHPATFATKDVTVTLGDATLRYGVDYLLDYAGNTAVGKATVTVRGIDKYSGTVAKTFTIELKNAPAPEPTLTSVSVKTKPSKLTYVVGDAFDPAGLVLQLNYDDDSTGTVTWNTQTAGDFTFKPALDAKLKVTDKTVTVTYQGKSAVIDSPPRPSARRIWTRPSRRSRPRTRIRPSTRPTHGRPSRTPWRMPRPSSRMIPPPSRTSIRRSRR